MKRKLLFIIILGILTINGIVNGQAPDPVISFSFDEDVSEGGTVTAETGGITGELKNSAYCAGGDLILEQTVDTLPDFVELDAASIEINTFSEFSVLISFTSDTLDYGGVTKQHISIWAFGDAYAYASGDLAMDYIYFAPSRQGTDKAQAFIACGYGPYCFEHQDTSANYVPNLMDDQEHQAVVSFDDSELGLFVDGDLVGYTSVNVDTNNIAAISNALAYLGRSTYGTSHVSQFKGRIHDFKIYDEALSEDDVTAIYTGVGINEAVNKLLPPNVYSTGSSVIIDLNSTENYFSAINIYDITGSLVKKLDNSGSRLEIPLASGVYIIQAGNESEFSTKKVIVYK